MTEKKKTLLREAVRMTRKSKHILKEQGIGILLKKARFEVLRRLFDIDIASTVSREKKDISVGKLLRTRFANARPLESMKVERSDFRLNIVTDSLQKDSLFGGVGTALLLATLFANKHNMPLRIITRTAGPNPRGYDSFLQLMNISKPKAVEFFSDWDAVLTKSIFKLPVSEKDIFLATSWWTAETIRGINLREKFFYILQEVEGFFYPHGDEQYRCESVLDSSDINFIVNSKLLNDYYAEHNVKQIHAGNSVYFEPAFPKVTTTTQASLPVKKSKYRLFFYARPNNARNMYFTGLRILDEALLRGIIKKDEWEICFAGSSIEPLEFTNKVKPQLLGQMNWDEYGLFLKTVDLAFCLMFTPHPSYPPLDVAANGGVVLTNTFANKTTLEHYSKNIVCVDLDMESMMQGFAEAIALAKNHEARVQNYTENSLLQDWNVAFEDVFEFMNEKK